MFQPKYLKEAKHLAKGVKKFLHYKQDLLRREQAEVIQRELTGLRDGIASRDRPKIELHSKSVRKACDRAFPQPKDGGLRENVEVIFVAIVVALGIRSYFLQPFRIPTGSMQPTLNGVVGFPYTAEEALPSALLRPFDKVLRGRSYVNVSPESDDLIIRIYERNHFRFFTRTHLVFRSGQDVAIAAPVAVVLRDFGLGALLEDRLGSESRKRVLTLLQDRRDTGILSNEPLPVYRGETLVRGVVHTGDQVLVDRVSYHFRRPQRGEVFVFTTKDIDYIEARSDFDPQQGSQHYIKRLTALPGDTIELRPPFLFIDGQEAQEAGIQRVMKEYAELPWHRGYEFPSLRQSDGVELEFPVRPYQVPSGEDRRYIAMGDNSGNSSDSRIWGSGGGRGAPDWEGVPENNLLGPALVVYWPFTSHWGPIK
ncbi:MAG: signal peptidase I [Verrucomicrobiota bacterium]